MTSPRLTDPASAQPNYVLPIAVDPCAVSLNENPLPPLPAVRSALVAALDSANRYPEYLPVSLRRLVADHVGVPQECVAIGPGSSELAVRIMQATARPGDRITLSKPTFDGYAVFARMAGLTVIDSPLDRYGHQDLPGMARIAADTRVVVLCRPHNPTGTLESVTEVERFIAELPSDVIVVLDEAYIEFVAPMHRMNVAELISRFPNVVVLRTFSKAYGLAGMRIGYTLAAPELTAMLWNLQMPFGISSSAAVAVAACYNAEPQLQQRIAHITAERAYLRDRLRAAGIYTPESHANFVYLPAGPPWATVFDDAGLRVRPYSDGAVRITVDSRSSTRMVLAAVDLALAAEY